jgi:hypothetical protein
MYCNKSIIWAQRQSDCATTNLLHACWFGLVWFGLVWFGLVWFVVCADNDDDGVIRLALCSDVRVILLSLDRVSMQRHLGFPIHKHLCAVSANTHSRSFGGEYDQQRCNAVQSTNGRCVLIVRASFVIM